MSTNRSWVWAADSWYQRSLQWEIKPHWSLQHLFCFRMFICSRWTTSYNRYILFTFHNSKYGLCVCQIKWMSERSLPGAKSLSWSKVTKRQQQISLRKGKSLMLSTDWVGWKCPKKSPIYPNCSPDVYLTSTSSPRTLGFSFGLQIWLHHITPRPQPP